MGNSGSAIRGSRIGANALPETDRGYRPERIERSYYCSNGHITTRAFSANLDELEFPEQLDCPNCGLPSGQDKDNPPMIAKHDPYKTHLAYVKERRTEDEAKELLEEAVSAIRERRERLNSIVDTHS